MARRKKIITRCPDTLGEFLSVLGALYEQYPLADGYEIETHSTEIYKGLNVYFIDVYK